MHLLIMGPPGAGKGTQAAVISQHFAVPTISTGDMFRAEVAAQSPLGREVSRILDSGGYVGDDITNKVVASRLEQPDVADGFLLDGYPRTTPQVAALDEILLARGRTLDAVIALDAEVDAVVARLSRRAGIEGRADDAVDAIRTRQQKYLEETAPLLHEYEARGLLIHVNALGTVDEVSKRIFAGLDAVSNKTA